MLIDPQSEKFNQFFAAEAESMFVEQPSWQNLIAGSFQRSHVVLGVEESKKLVGVACLFIRESRATTALMSASGGGLFWKSESGAKKLVSEIEKYALAHRLRYTQVYLQNPLPVSLSPQWKTDERFARVVFDLATGEEDIWKNKLRDKTRNQIRKAQKIAFSFEKANSPNNLKIFHHVLNKGTRDLGSPCPSLRFFKKISAQFNSTATFLVARKDEQPAAAALLLHHKGVTAIPWALTLKSYRTTSLNMLLYWNIIQESLLAGSRQLDMGRSMIGSGTYKFKINFGGTAKQLYYYYYLPQSNEMPNIHPENPKFFFARKVWSHLPTSITALLGHEVIKRVF